MGTNSPALLLSMLGIVPLPGSQAKRILLTLWCHTLFLRHYTPEKLKSITSTAPVLGQKKKWLYWQGFMDLLTAQTHLSLSKRPYPMYLPTRSRRQSGHLWQQLQLKDGIYSLVPYDESDFYPILIYILLVLFDFHSPALYTSFFCSTVAWPRWKACKIIFLCSQRLYRRRWEFWALWNKKWMPRLWAFPTPVKLTVLVCSYRKNGPSHYTADKQLLKRSSCPPYPLLSFCNTGMGVLLARLALLLSWVGLPYFTQFFS